ncbi:MAG: hypothetical protein OEZ23_07980, partial [Gammaproteobacteria bacterium]|nr:hypothetical protein [Gammaproteobacteria bacterium]
MIAIILITIFPAVSLAAGTLNRYEASSLDTGTAFEQRVFTARLYEPGTYELVVISVDAENRRHLDIYRMGEGGFEPFVYLGFELPEGLIAVDKLSVHGLDQIVFLTGNGVEAWNPSTENFNLLVTSTSAYKTPVWRSLPRIQLVKDINEDGLEDLMIPDFEGYHIFLQRKSEGKGGIEFDRVTLPIAEVMDIYYGNNPAYHFRGYYSGDYNLDGLKDVWFWDGRQF